MSFLATISTLIMILVAGGFILAVEIRQFRCRREFREFEKLVGTEAPQKPPPQRSGQTHASV